MSNLLKIEHNGVSVRNSDNGEFYCLTDMWKACGSDPNKKPADWQRKEGAPFIEFIEENLKVPSGHIELIRVVRGGNDPGTWAHWQIALAYAKYLPLRRATRDEARCYSLRCRGQQYAWSAENEQG